MCMFVFNVGYELLLVVLFKWVVVFVFNGRVSVLVEFDELLRSFGLLYCGGLSFVIFLVILFVCYVCVF